MTSIEPQGGFDVYLIKVNPAGKLIWQKTVGYSDNDYGFDSCGTYDNGYIAVGATSSDDFPGATHYHRSLAYALKINADCDMECENAYGIY